MRSSRLLGAGLLLAVSSAGAQKHENLDKAPFELGTSFGYHFFGGDVGLTNLDHGPGIDVVMGYRSTAAFGIRARVRLSSHEQTLFVIGLPRNREVLFSLGLEPHFRSGFDRGIAAYLTPRIGYLAATAVTDAALELGVGAGVAAALTQRLTLETGVQASAARSQRNRVFQGSVTHWNSLLSLSIGLMWGGRTSDSN